jgi:hypothetical protein
MVSSNGLGLDSGRGSRASTKRFDLAEASIETGAVDLVDSRSTAFAATHFVLNFREKVEDHTRNQRQEKENKDSDGARINLDHLTNNTVEMRNE